MLAADHVGTGMAPLPTLAAIAAATTTIRLGTLVLNNDMRNPVQLAWEVASIDALSGGRFELGLGAGHTPQEYAATGIERSAPASASSDSPRASRSFVRCSTARSVDHDGEHYRIERAHIDRSTQPASPDPRRAATARRCSPMPEPTPTSSACRASAERSRTAIVTRSTGARHTTRRQIEQVRAGADERFDDVAFNALVQIVQITDDREAALETICERVEGLTMADAETTPYLLVGTVEEIVLHMLTCNERWGINYFAVRELDDFEPVLEALGR